MSLMKKYINSLFILLILLCLTSCTKKDKIFVLDEDYNLINQNLELSFFTNTYQSVYLKKENIVNVYLKDSENIFIVDLIDVFYKGKNNDFFQYDLIFDTTFISDELLILKRPIIEIEYINQKIMSYQLGSIALFRGNVDVDLSMLAIKGVYDPYLKGIILTLKNKTEQTISLLDINLINAYFGADLLNLQELTTTKELDGLCLDNYQPYQNETLLSKNIEIKTNEIKTYFVPVCYENEIKGNQTAILIQYQINGLVKEMGIKNFIFVNTE